MHNNADSLDPSKLWLLDDLRLGRKESDMMIIGADYHPSFQEIDLMESIATALNKVVFLAPELGSASSVELQQIAVCVVDPRDHSVRSRLSVA